MAYSQVMVHRFAPDLSENIIICLQLETVRCLDMVQTLQSRAVEEKVDGTESEDIMIDVARCEKRLQNVSLWRPHYQ